MRITILRITLVIAVSMTALQSHAQNPEPDGDETVYNLYLDNLVTDRNKAMEICEIYLSGIDSTKAGIHTAALCDSLAQWYEKEKFQFTKAINLMEQALSIYHKEHCADKEADIKYKLGRMYLKINQYHKTLAYAHDAALYFTYSRNTEKYLDCCNLLGIVYHICMDYDKSTDYFAKMAKGAREINDTSRLAAALNNSALLAGTLKDTLKAENIALEAARLCIATRDTAVLCQCYLNLASQFIGRDSTKAENYLALAKEYLTDIDMAGDYHRIYGMLLISENRFEKATNEFEKALTYYAEGEFNTKRLFCLNILYNIYETSGKEQEAYAALKEYHRIDKSTSDKNTYFELFQTQNDIILKDEHLKLEEAKARQQFAWLSAISLLTIAILTTWYVFKRKKMRIRQNEAELRNQQLLYEKKQQEIQSKKEILEIKQMQQYKIDKILKKVMDKLDKLSGSINNEPVKEEINALCSDLKNTREENSWKEISLYVPEFNSELFNDLVKAFPNLSINEKRLLALLNINMTTKDIAKITMQSPHSINIARYRLRAKLGLTGSDKTIQEFLSEFKKKEENISENE